MAYTKVKTGKMLACQECGTKVYVVTYRQASFKYCSKVCSGKKLPKVQRKPRFGKDSPNYKGGYVTKDGYRAIYVAGKRIYEHRHVMAQVIGRRLKRTEQVHHLDHNKLNNDPSNLLLLGSAREHREYHAANDAGFKRVCRRCHNSFSADMQAQHICLSCRTFACKRCGKISIMPKYLRQVQYCSPECGYGRNK